VKKYMDYEVEGVRRRGWPKKTLSKVIETDCLTRHICNENVVDCKKWRKLIKDKVNVFLALAHPDRPG